MNDVTDMNGWFISFPTYLLKTTLKKHIISVNQIYLRHMDIQNSQILDFNDFSM